MSPSPGPAVPTARTVWALAGAAVLLFVGAGCSNPTTTDRIATDRIATDRTDRSVVDCASFAAFLDQPAMPIGITAATCTYESWLDEGLTAEFDLADLSALEDWLEDLPATEPLEQYSDGDVVKYDQISFSPRLEGGADCLDVTAVRSADGFHVSMSAFNV